MTAISPAGRYCPPNKRNRIFTTYTDETFVILEREGMYERDIKYKNSGRSLNKIVNPHSSEGSPRNFMYFHGVQPGMNAILENRVEEDVKIDDQNQHNSLKMSRTKLKEDRKRSYMANRIKSGAMEKLDKSGLKPKSKKSRPRSKSPSQENYTGHAKVVTFDTDSENPDYTHEDIESDAKLKRLDFDDSSSNEDDNMQYIGSHFDSNSDDELKIEDESDTLIDEEDIKFTSNDCVVIVSFRLPLKAIKDENGEFKLVSSGSLLFSQLYNLRQRELIKSRWIGIPSYQTTDEEEQEQLIKLYEKYDCVPLFVDPKLLDEFMHYYENLMKPLFYNFKGLYDDNHSAHEYDDWHCFKVLNEKFTEKIIAVKDVLEEEYSNVFIWLNNDQLFLVPQSLRRRIRYCHIGMYIHSPFPSSDIFRMFPYGKIILRSLLDCDCLGFHVYEHARHFIVCCKRVLGLDTEMNKNGHFVINSKGEDPVMIRIGHAGVVPDAIRKTVQSDEFQQQLCKREKESRIVLSSIDPLSHFSGIRAKLIAYRKFLKRKPTYPRDCKLIQYLVLPKVVIEDDYEGLKDSITELETSIIEEFGDSVLSIRETSPDDIERYLIWADTDILFITNKRDGLYMSPLEYIVIRSAIGKSKKSSILISEFVGGANLLAGAFKFNPYNIRDMVSCLEHAVCFESPQDKELKFNNLKEYVDVNTIERWAYRFLRDIKLVHQNKNYMLGIEGKQILANKLLIQKTKELLSNKDFLRGYKSASSRLIIIFMDRIKEQFIENCYGTSQHSETDSDEDSNFDVTPSVYSLINRLAKNKNNKVWLISSEDRHKVHNSFSKIKNLGLAAEDGYFYRWDSNGDKTANDWTKLVDDQDPSWIKSVKSILQIFTEASDNSFIEERSASISWNFHRLEPEYGQGQVKELHFLLKDVFKNFDIDMQIRKGVLEIKPNADTKDLIKKIFQKMSMVAPIDFAFAFGNETKYSSSYHEICVRFLEQFLNQKQDSKMDSLVGGYKDVLHMFNNQQKLTNHCSNNIPCVTCSIKDRPVLGKYYIEDLERVLTAMHMTK